MIIGITGHRPKLCGGYIVPNPIYDGICADIKKALLEYKPEEVITGMALGVDTWVAQMCVEMEIPFIAAVPFVGQEGLWNGAAIVEYRRLLELADETITVSEGGYSARKMQIRNTWIVDECDMLMAVYNGKKGSGTHNCLTYAKSVNKRTHIIPIK